eukprot:scaffold518_cov388-Prasinococcus_capsulatus_cf.AAC.12
MMTLCHPLSLLTGHLLRVPNGPLGKYVIVEVGRQFGMWSVRGLKALHQLAPAMPYKALVVNSDRRKAEAHFSDNGLTMESVKENLRNSSSFMQVAGSGTSVMTGLLQLLVCRTVAGGDLLHHLMQVLHRYDHIDFLYVGDFQMEAFSTTWNKKRSAQYQFDDALLQLINQKVCDVVAVARRRGPASSCNW